MGRFLYSVFFTLISLSTICSAQSPLSLRQYRGGPPAGVVIRTCSVPGTFALTFDDGPGLHTNTLLDQLDKIGVKVTFFIDGNNVGGLDDEGVTKCIQRAYNAGHQIASHTFSHANLTMISPDQVRSEMSKLDEQIKRAIGVRPTYMRPPFGATNGQVLGILRDLGYRVIRWSVDTNDWRHPDDAEASLMVLRRKVRNVAQGIAGIALAHDTMPSTATRYVEAAARIIRKKGYRLTTISECLGDGSDAYRV
ncbi:polysaccharide deacetylase [Thamnocephalis sphaerospora]|uniref:Polysaccharide deacetylase n=1 Tax=Thamnocephalis sphaerospora TaxID=78915 RepID=A0A4P9XU57_9FUNG|nr:polysaccharide deacetylase [Thamnocephalis sphaerospora]|eukprot:RKP09472.1 polysaccharide deacetylase [Thamnocephalis sphaerospora]